MNEHTGNPVVNCLIILLGVLDVVMNFARVIRFTGSVPCAHVNTDSETLGKQLLCGLDVNVLGCSRGSGMEVRVVRSKLATDSCTACCQKNVPKEVDNAHHPCEEQPRESSCNSNGEEQSQPCCS